MQHSAPSLAAQNKLITLFGHVFAKSGMQNTITSPLSMYACLAMLAEGSSGQTYDELARVFGYVSEGQVIDPAMANALESLHAGCGKGAVIKMCNMLFVNKMCPLKADFIKTVVTKHRAAAENVDFGDASTTVKINSKIEQSTNGLIKDCITDLSADTACVLVNTIYFKGIWKKKFDKSRTGLDVFTLADGKTVDVEFMAGEMSAALFTTTEAKYLSLPYEGNRIKFVVELPTKKKLTQLDAGAVIKVATESSVETVDVNMPRFKFEFKTDLIPVLEGLGIKGAIDGTGMHKMTNSDVRVSKVIHQAFIQVDEEGTEAAAATAIVMLTYCMPMPSIRFDVDSPFFFHIVDSATSTILFTGAVQKPEFK